MLSRVTQQVRRLTQEMAILSAERDEANARAEAARRAGRALTRDGFISAIQSMQNVNLGGFPVDFSPSKHTGSKFVELTLLTEDGRIRR